MDMHSCNWNMKAFWGGGSKAQNANHTEQCFNLYTVAEGINIPHSLGNVTLHPFWLSSSNISPSDLCDFSSMGSYYD